MPVQSPFPELKSFEVPPEMPSLANLATLPRHDLEASPIPEELAPEAVGPARGAKVFPSIPEKTALFEIADEGSLDPVTPFVIQSAEPVTETPAPDEIELSDPSPQQELDPESDDVSCPIPPALAAQASTTAGTTTSTSPMPAQPVPVSPFQAVPASATDEDLKQALVPLIEDSLQDSAATSGSELQKYLEPMLRSTVRRAIAEQIDSAVQFRATNTLDRLGWRVKALFTSRSYDEVVFRATRRYQVEEAFLLRKEDFSLVSFASHDPGRHTSEKRVASTVKKLTRRLLNKSGALVRGFDLRNDQVAIVREGKHCLLIAVVRGSSNALVRTDLDYVLQQSEDRFESGPKGDGKAFLHILQPILEGCLLIQSPAPPA